MRHIAIVRASAVIKLGPLAEEEGRRVWEQTCTVTRRQLAMETGSLNGTETFHEQDESDRCIDRIYEWTRVTGNLQTDRLYSKEWTTPLGTKKKSFETLISLGKNISYFIQRKTRKENHLEYSKSTEIMNFSFFYESRIIQGWERGWENDS